jgi:hypothetical protein
MSDIGSRSLIATLIDLSDVRPRPTGQVALFETEVIEGPTDILGNGHTLQICSAQFDFLSRIDIGRFTAPTGRRCQ